MFRPILQLLLTATLLLNAVGAPWAMAAMSHDTGHATPPAEQTAMADSAIQGHDQHDMHHAQMSEGMHPIDDATTADPESMGSCCTGTTCHCGCVLPPALLFAVVPQFSHFVVLMPRAISVERSQALPSTPPFRPPSV